jgi:hypothetical protein
MLLAVMGAAGALVGGCVANEKASFGVFPPEHLDAPPSLRGQAAGAPAQRAAAAEEPPAPRTRNAGKALSVPRQAQ